jgi:hypothetical protein
VTVDRGLALTSPLEVELLHILDCPNVEKARHLLRECLNELGLTNVEVVDTEGSFASPSIVVNGIDVMGAPTMDVASCRLDLPTRERVMTELTAGAR